MQLNHNQPILGIMALYVGKRKRLAERLIYEEMIIFGKKLGIDVFVFTPEDIDERRHCIYALHYYPRTKRWIRKWIEFPNMIFDRCRHQNRRYNATKMSQFREKYNYNDLLFLNMPIGDKWGIYQVLSTVPSFEKHLPFTRLYQSIQDVQEMLHIHPLIYLKPIDGTGGQNILRVEWKDNNSLYMQGRERLEIIPYHKLTLRQLAAKLDKRDACNHYLVQQGIPVKLPNNCVHDYRMLVQKNGKGAWEVTGCVGRVGNTRSVTSNLHGGGAAVCMDELLHKWIDDENRIAEVKDEAGRIGIEIPPFLEQHYGVLCELALDLAIDRTGHIWLLEVNAKPAREVFNRIGDQDTYELAIKRPLEYAAWVYQHQQQEKR